MLHPRHYKKKPGSFHKKKQDLPGVPKIVKNDPDIFQNSWSTIITYDELETCLSIPMKTEKAQIMGVQ